MILTSLMIAATVVISVIAGWQSFLAIRDLAIAVGWPSHMAWAVMPVIELFILVGAAEVALRMWDGRDDLAKPRALAFGALLVTLALNVVDHLVKAPGRSDPGGLPAVEAVMISGLAAAMPLAQILALHVLIERLRAIGERTAASTMPVRRRQAPAVSSPSGARRPKPQLPSGYTPASDEDRLMYEAWLTGLRNGTEPSGSDLARAAGKDPETGIGRKAARRYRRAHGMTGTGGTARRTDSIPDRGTDLRIVGTDVEDPSGTTSTEATA